MKLEPGALPPPSFIPLCVPEVRGNEWKYIKECLDTGWVSSVGAYVDRFEAAMAARAGTRFAVATVNGTSALHIALLVAGIRPDDEVLVSSLTFIAPANAIRYAGAWPVFIDAELDFWQMDLQRAADFLNRRCRFKDGALYNSTSGRRVKAIMPVHILGHPCDMDPLLELARKFNLAVIEDATESLGAAYHGKKTGHLGDVACFSFNGNKLITTGGGGMITTDRQDWAERAKYLTTQAKDDPLEFVHHTVGYNYRLTNIQAAMGCAQLEMLDEYLAKKRRIAARYENAFKAIPGIAKPREAKNVFCSYWLYTVLFDAVRFGMGSREVMAALGRHKIQARPFWQPMHRSPAHQGCEAVGGEVADRLNRDGLSIPCSTGLTDAQQDQVISAIHSLLKSNS